MKIPSIIALTLWICLTAAAQQQANNFRVLTNLFVGNNIQGVTLNGYNIDAIATNSAANKINITNGASSGLTLGGNTVYGGSDSNYVNSLTGDYIVGLGYNIGGPTLKVLANSVQTVSELTNSVNPGAVSFFSVVNVQGFSSATDGGGGTFRKVFSSGLAVTTNGPILPANNATFAWQRVLNGQPLTPRMFGAQGNGTNNDWAAMQAAVSYTTTNQLSLHIPAGTYILTNKLVIRTNTTGWSITGDGAGTILKQTASSGNGTPIFEFQGGQIDRFTISDLALEWSDVAGVPASGYKNVGFMFAWDGVSDKGAGVYNFSLERMAFTFGFRCISNYDLSSSTSSGVNVWGMAVKSCRVTYMAGGSVRLSNAGSGGSPNVTIADFHINGTTYGASVVNSLFIYSDPQFFCDSATSWKFDGVEINNLATSVPAYQFTGPGAAITFDNCRVEAALQTTTAALLDFDNIGVVINSFEISNLNVRTNIASKFIEFDSSNTNTALHELVIDSIDHQGNPTYPTLNLQPGASLTLVDAAVGTLAFVGNLPPVVGATTYGRSAPMLNGAENWRAINVTAGTNYTPNATSSTNVPNWYRVTCASNTLTINAVTGAVSGSEYVFDFSSAAGTRLQWISPTYQVTDIDRAVASGDRKVVRFLFDGTNMVQTASLPAWGGGNRVLLANAQQGGIAAVDLSTGTGANTPTNRWRISKTATTESGASAGSDLAVERYDDSGAQTGVPLAITRSNGNVTITSTVATVNAGQTIIQGGYGNDLLIGTTGGTAGASIRAGANATALLQLNSGSLARWRLTKETTPESGSNAGANFTLESYNDAGAYLATPINVNRANGLSTLTSLNVIGGMTQNSVAVALKPTTETLAYVTTNVTLTAGKGPNQLSLLTVTNNFQLLWSGLTPNDRGVVHLIPATTNVTILVSSPGRAAGSSAATATGSTTLTITGATNGWAELTWDVVSVGGTNRVSVNLGTY